jgi:hypothetical protein
MINEVHVSHYLHLRSCAKYRNAHADAEFNNFITECGWRTYDKVVTSYTRFVNGSTSNLEKLLSD